ncbi:MAG TPA: 1-acyl-sn-glycerol-3-phosphate acyltransferase, partial [Candidatus Lachnoclostridium stercorigallinarum]|nr:1-acyl-sn-glycerol-3-phosphate acyltransferase [Candidatus Lachnoclostridium stercorigallinarum]
MDRIVWMVFRNLFRAPIWFYHIIKMGREDTPYTEQERYDYIRRMVKTVNRTGRVTVEVHGLEYIPEKNGFIMFPNHQGLFDVLALIEASSHPFGVVIKKEASGIILVKQVVRLLRGIA